MIHFMYVKILKFLVPLSIQMACSRTSVLELVLELVQELQMAGSRTSILPSVDSGAGK